MAPRKRSSAFTTESVDEQVSTSKKRKQLKNDADDNIGGKKKTPVKTKTKSKKNLNTSQEVQNKSEIESMEMQGMSVDDMNIEQLLALGEKSQGVGFGISEDNDFEDSSDSDTSDFEEVKNANINELVIPKEGVNITLEIPDLYNKHKKKGFDFKAHLRRQMNRVKKDLQLLMHKVHILCWIAHLRFVNSVLNKPSLMTACASLVKSKNLYPSKYADISYLEGILKWFHKNIELKKEVSDPLCTGGLFEELNYQIEKKQAFTCKAFVFIFIILLRVLGLKARIVMSFQVLPVKPSLLELYSDSIKERSEKLKKLKEEKEASTSKEKSDSSTKKTVKSPCQLSTSRKSINEKSDKCKKRAQVERKNVKSNIKVDISDDECESEHFKPSVESSEKHKKSKTKKTRQSDLELSSKSKNVKVKENQMKNNITSNEDEDSDFREVSLKKKSKKKTDGKSDTVSEEFQKTKESSDIWAEIYVEAEEKWISVDVPRQKIHCIQEIYSRATHPVTYIVACNNDHTLKDVTKRYVPNWHSTTRKKRVDEEWWNDTMKPYLPSKTAQDKEEDDDINRQLLDRPLPCSISEFKDHPLYALQRHLLKFEAIYPPDAPTLGFVRGEPVYARECVHTLHSREMWYKQARLVRLKEEPYKTVKARPKYDKMTGEVKKDLPLELYGRWQTEDYIPPIATGGKVPRNEYGNVDLFKPCMLPIGTVHLQIPALNRIAKKLDIDCAPATVGFDFHSGGSHPVFDGFIVCEEFKDVLLDAWNKEADESAKKEADKRDKRVYSNWKRLIRGLLIREKLKMKYAFGENSEAEDDSEVLPAKASTCKPSRNK